MCIPLRILLCIATATAVLSVSQHTEDATAASSSNSSTPATGWPQHEVYSNTWVQQNIALTYAPETTRDGLGAQAFRILGIYAIAKSLGIGYLHQKMECVGHIGQLPHYHKIDCQSHLTLEDRRLLSRVQRLVVLPSSHTNTSSWHVAHLDNVMLTWDMLRNATQTALLQRQPTLIKLARVQWLLCQYPDVFNSVPALRPQKVMQTVYPENFLQQSRVRIAVHLRRGDITHNKTHLRRLLPIRFYVNVLKQLLQALQAASQDGIVEVFTERPTTPQARVELRELRRSIPNLVLLLDTDHVWNWRQMATADIQVLSLSMYSVVPALLNPSAIHVGPFPAALDEKPISVFRMHHWFSALDHNGTLPAAVQQEIKARYQQPSASGTAAGSGALGRLPGTKYVVQ